MPRLRFRLRSLLFIVGLFALACWAYWVGWPLWEDIRFESKLKGLKAGVTAHDVWVRSQGPCGYNFALDPDGRTIGGVMTLLRPNRIYFVHYTLPVETGDHLETPCTSLSVFRFEQIPAYFQQEGDRSASEFSESLLKSLQRPTEYQIPDKYELIPADPVDAAQ